MQTGSYTFFATVFSNLLNYKTYVTIRWSEKTLITCQTTKNQYGGYLTVRIKKTQNISKSLFFVGTELNEVILN